MKNIIATVIFGVSSLLLMFGLMIGGFDQMGSGFVGGAFYGIACWCYSDFVNKKEEVK